MEIGAPLEPGELRVADCREDDAKEREKMKSMRVALIQRVLSTGETPGAAEDSDSTRKVLWPDEDEFD